jgi:hypothetical protein
MLFLGKFVFIQNLFTSDPLLEEFKIKYVDTSSNQYSIA